MRSMYFAQRSHQSWSCQYMLEQSMTNHDSHLSCSSFTSMILPTSPNSCLNLHSFSSMILPTFLDDSPNLLNLHSLRDFLIYRWSSKLQTPIHWNFPAMASLNFQHLQAAERLQRQGPGGLDRGLRLGGIAHHVYLSQALWGVKHVEERVGLLIPHFCSGMAEWSKVAMQKENCQNLILDGMIM